MNKKVILCLTICIAITIIATEKLAKESFIIKPKPKKESRSSILESIATLLMNNAKINPKVIEQAARLEQSLLEHGTVLLAQEKNSPFDSAENSALQEYRTCQQECHARLQEISSSLEWCNSSLAQSFANLNKTIYSTTKN